MLAAGLAACQEAQGPSRQDRIVTTILAADAALLAERPGLVAGKYARMRDDLYSYYRGTMALWLRDAVEGAAPVAETRFATDARPVCLGDSHPENFGTLRAGGDFALEGNDFDAADRYPYLLDLRRLTVGMVLAARLSNEDDEDARAEAAAAAGAIVEATARGYAEAVAKLAEGKAAKRFDNPGGVRPLEDLFDRADDAWDDRDEWEGGLTRVVDGRRVLARGALDPEDPTHALVDLPAEALEALGPALVAWRASLDPMPGEGHLVVKDAARELGTGLASWPRVRALVLVEGDSPDPDDDVVLEVKELADSGAAPWLGAGPWDGDPRARILATTVALWARPDADPLWGVSTWLGWPVQVRTEAAWHRTVRVRRLTGKRGTPKELRDLGGDLGALVARMHATGDAAVPGLDGTAAAIAAAIAADEDGWVAEQVTVSLALADRVEQDWALFVAALEERGPLLGAPTGGATVTPLVEAVLAAPPLP